MAILGHCGSVSGLCGLGSCPFLECLWMLTFRFTWTSCNRSLLKGGPWAAEPSAARGHGLRPARGH